MSNKLNKLKIGILSRISEEWINMYDDKLEIVKSVDEADYIIFESNGDPISLIMNIKMRYPKNKLVFILSGDQSVHIDDECIWFSNAVKQSGLSRKQTQIFVSNPAIFKYYENNRSIIDLSVKTLFFRDINIYFKGTIWDGMRTTMYNYFKDKMGCKIVQNNNYWSWRCNGINKPTQEQIEETAYESYNNIVKSKLCLCPKGNGNSSMRIIEALACGSIPVLIDDCSAPFGMSWNEICLVFDTKIHNWDYIYSKCLELLEDTTRMQVMQIKGLEYFNNVIYGDSRLSKYKMYNDINSVCFGFSNKIINNLYDFHNCKKK
jgi:hypothetical protein